jgi:hypothetical protein
MVRAFVLATAGLILTGLPVAIAQSRAEDAPVTPPPAPVAAEPLSDARIDELCGRLGAADFSSRELATKELLAGGSAVIDKVAAAAETDSLEVVIRCLTILKELYQRPEEQTRGAVAAALQRLSGNRRRSTARRAAEILNPPEIANATSRQIQLRRLNAPAGGVAFRVFQAGNAVGGGNGGTSIRITNDNGNVRVNAVEGGRTVVITHQNESNIIVCITHPPGAGENAGKTTVHPARNLAELKEKHPEAHRFYEQYCVGMQRLAGGGIVPPPPRPEPPP